MIKIAIVEDEEIYRKQLQQFLLRFQKEEKCIFQVDTYESGSLFYNTALEKGYDILLLDIVLKDSIDGLSLAKKIRAKDSQVLISFITTMIQYAVNGYEVDALGYMVKPIHYFDFSLLMKKLLSRLSSRQEIYLTYSRKGEFAKIPSSHITYIEVRNHDLTIHTIHGNYEMRGSLDAVEEELQKKDFSRCNNCYLVNLAFVKEIKGNQVVVNEEELQISRPKKKAFLDALTDFYGGKA